MAVGFVACGGSDEEADQVKRCNVVCADQADCTDAPVTADQCGSVCESNASSSKTASCTKEYDALLSCTEALDDKCTTTTDCGPGVGKDWADCIQRYCTTHSGSSACGGG